MLAEAPFEVFCPSQFTRYAPQRGISGFQQIPPHAPQNELRAHAPDGDPMMLYVHIPYCTAYCSFCRFARSHKKNNDEPIRRYLDALKRELTSYLQFAYFRPIPFYSIHVGGGTPSVVPAKLMADFLEWLQRTIGGSRRLPISFEGDAETLKDPELLRALRSVGCTRVSTGAQTFDPALRKICGRSDSLEDIEETFENARKAGFDEIAIDLLMWLPGQRVENVCEDVRKAVALGPTDIDWYIVVLDPWKTSDAMSRKVKAGAFPAMASLDEVLEMRSAITAGLLEAGYHQQIVDHFSKLSRIPHYHINRFGGGDGSARTLGLGVGSQSNVGDYIWMNADKEQVYLTALLSGESTIAEAVRLSAEDHLERAVFYFPRNMVIRKDLLSRCGDRIREHYDGKFERLCRLGLVEETVESFQLTTLGKLWYSNVVCELSDKAANWKQRNREYMEFIDGARRASSRRLAVVNPPSEGSGSCCA